MSRSLAFEDSNSGFKLSGPKISTHSAISRSSCAIRCQRTPSCKSYNFCYNNICELNSIGAHKISASAANANIWLLRNYDCIYAGMTKQCLPKCEQFGTEISVTNDTSDPNICQINQKRADCQILEPWRQTLIDTEAEWKFYSERNVSESFYGGVDNCTSFQIDEWFIWVDQKMSFENAKNHCQSIGGQLFGDINGTDEQFNLLLRKQNYENFWLGITDKDSPDVYMSLSGKNVTNFIHWAGQLTPAPEPSRGSGDEYVCMCREYSPIPPYESFEWFHDVPDEYFFRFPCTMIWVVPLKIMSPRLMSQIRSRFARTNIFIESET